MARMPGAAYRPVRNFHPNGVREHRGLVLHVQDGNNSPFGWDNDPASQASSDFWVSKSGVIEQYVNTGVDYAWAQAAGNPYYASVETEGHPNESLTDAQVEGVARIYAWGRDEWNWPLVVVDSTTAHGLTYHGIGGDAWGGHTGCPGELRKAQRSRIIARAGELVTPPAPHRTVSVAHMVTAMKADGAGPQSHVTYKTEALLLESALYAEGLLEKQWVDGSLGIKAREAYATWQRSKAGGSYSGSAADGYPGIQSLSSLGRRHNFLAVA
ncbi:MULTISPECIES: N-acetylmuramoyl-L-alanine amidase [Streptomyces]|uniref:N-acetylmuramoyl-L-alanine amidase n=1 Tax=Streptomyces TaxID=1883 RepID=UPI00068ED87D|nr:N-acetylmuramoyl-L-alanine amidase [Streptomyces durhamensis]